MRVELTRAGSVRRRTVRVPSGEPIRALLHRLGESPEGCAVLIDDVPVPLDTPIAAPVRLVVLPTFSGG